MSLRNIFACLVHESRDCIVDLVQNLHCLDPSSLILLYNGSGDPDLLTGMGFPFGDYNAVLHPAARRMKWGYLHPFALDCLRWGLAEHPFDALTVVDSDQLAVRAGYSQFLGEFLAARPRVGLLGSNTPAPGTPPKAPPAAAAWKERDLWRPFLRRFPDGESRFVHWTFWPSTVFTAAAARDLVALWDGDKQLAQIMERSKIWATEEVVLPTLVALLGHEVAASPFSYEFVKYRVSYKRDQVAHALGRPDVFWMHPVPRMYDHPIRRAIREHHGEYLAGAPAPRRPLLRPAQVIAEVRPVEGWLSDAEVDLLMAGVGRALEAAPDGGTIVEVGSYCGKATIALGRVAEASRAGARVYALDPHDGVLGARDVGLHQYPPSLPKLRRNLAAARLTERVEVMVGRAPELAWDRPVHFLLVDGLHDAAAVTADFARFEPHLAEGAVIAFHDYAEYFPGVKAFVNGLLSSGRYQWLARVDSLVLLTRRSGAALEPARAAPVLTLVTEAAPRVEVAPARPRVSCIMPTADRAAFVPHAIRHFLAQDYPDRELVIVDDGQDPIGQLLPDDPRLRYLRLDRRRRVGTKRNLACQQATGQIIVHWDDDDWSAPDRLTYQVGELLAGDAAICGLARVLYHQPTTGKSWQFIYPPSRRAWVSGNTLCYRRGIWEATPFDDVDVGEDARFVWSDPRRSVRALERNDFFVAMVHGRNVDPKRTKGRYWQPYPTEAVRAIMGGELDAYQQAASALAARRPLARSGAA
jgi:hypothetical protein